MGSSQVKVEFIGDTSRLQNATRKAEGSLKQLGNKFKKGFSLSGAAGPLAAAASIGLIVNAIGDATKAYYADLKAQKLLASQIHNVTGANETQIKSVEDQIAKMSVATAITDDKLRPAMAQLTQSTGNTAAAMRLLSLATNISAGTGKDLNSVAISLGKAYNGNTGSLKKLGITIKDTANFTGELEARYAGLAETAANNDPMGKMAIQMEQVNEKIGAAFAPLVEEFVKWLEGPAGEAGLQSLVDIANLLGVALKVVMDILEPVLIILSPILKLISWLLQGVSKVITNLTHVFDILAKVPFIKGIIDAVGGALKPVIDMIAGGLKLLGLVEEQAPAANSRSYSTTGADRAAAVSAENAQREAASKKRAASLKKAAEAAKAAAKETANRLKDAAKTIQDGGKDFKDAVDLSLGLSENKDFFNVQPFLDQTRKIVQAAKELPAKLKALRKAGASSEVIQNIVAQGPIAGNAIATGFLQQGGVKEYSKALSTLDLMGQQSAVQGNAAYTININKANMTAEEIIKAIQVYEKKTGRKVVF